MRRTLCIWLPDWTIQRRGARPARKALTASGPRPAAALVVYEQYRQGSFRVAACSEGARRRGVFPGMPLAEATALAPAQLEADDPGADLAALQELGQWCERFSPLVGLENSARPESLLLDIEGIAPLFGGEEALAERIARSFARRGLVARLAVADTVGAAWAAAHYAACDDGKAYRIVPSGRDVAMLESLPVEALRLSPPTVRVLARLGIRCIGELLALPRAGLASRFEPELIERLNQALGAVAEPIASLRPPPEITAERLLEYPLDEREAAAAILGQLIEQVAADLAARCQGAIQLECRFDCQNGEPARFLVGLFEASAAAGHLLGLARLQLEQVRLPGPVTAVRVSVLSATRLPVRQQELFADERRDRRQLALLADRLSNRLQREAVSRAVLVPDAQPEYAYHYEPLTGNGVQRLSKKKDRRRASPRLAGPALQRPWPRPLRLQAAAEPLEAPSSAPKGMLAQFDYRGRRRRVLRRWGPERIQTGWWRGRPIGRDYYRIEIESGERFWVFRRLHDSQWFLHGIFD